MSLSKPFPVSHLPFVPLENVLLLLDPKDLLFFALSSEKARQLLRKFSLAEYFDIDVYKNAVVFLFRLKSGKLMKWTVRMCPSDWKLNKPTVLDLDDMRMDLSETYNGVECGLSNEHFSDWTQRIGYFLHSIFPCRRIRKFGAGMVGWGDKKVFFHMENITSCEKFHFDRYNGDNFLEILEKTDVKRELTMRGNRHNHSNLKWMKNGKIRNIPSLKLISIRNLTFSRFLKLENEQIHLERCPLTGSNGSLVNAYLKKWMNGEFTKSRTLKVIGYPEQGLDDTVWDGLTKEPLETWEKLGKPGLVQFSDDLYLKPNPGIVSDNYRTDLLKNCRGQFATVVQTFQEFYFVSWDLPLLPINIPVGYKLRGSSDSPFIKASRIQV